MNVKFDIDGSHAAALGVFTKRIPLRCVEAVSENTKRGIEFSITGVDRLSN
jgi:hypothetical protein